MIGKFQVHTRYAELQDHARIVWYSELSTLSAGLECLQELRDA